MYADGPPDIAVSDRPQADVTLVCVNRGLSHVNKRGDIAVIHHIVTPFPVLESNESS